MSAATDEQFVQVGHQLFPVLSVNRNNNSVAHMDSNGIAIDRLLRK
ncbi:hypothetical protein SNE25_08865 [Mucilaginibacter sabulilitoris]|uniref:Uncharacterized protein n=1 Tax=Mucilaginibacter sabulilitoris TaxID=1173583 RepID=A0ABZ0TU78_9SPHI|nr:hypothetical protein [Mucilaginibacter sabulilitoris]WPU95628.1 hypothetical protein SNE25_08865 [Mucilaginibacter sabulilitoris]